MQGGGGIKATQYEESKFTDTIGPLVYGQPAAASAIARGPVPFSNLAKAEDFSSPGPARHVFGPVLNAAPAPFIEPGPQTIAKPDIAAIDGGPTTFFSQMEPDGAWRFFGTSAAAPHAAAVVALMRQANPTATPAQVSAALAAGGRTVGPFGPNIVGAGLLDAFASVKAIELPPKVTITRGPPARTRDNRPSFEFSSNRPVSFRCQLGGGNPAPCTSPFTVPAALNDGSNSLTVSGIDGGGKAGSSHVEFVVDTKAPGTLDREASRPLGLRPRLQVPRAVPVQVRRPPSELRMQDRPWSFPLLPRQALACLPTRQARGPGEGRGRPWQRRRHAGLLPLLRLLRPGPRGGAATRWQPRASPGR